MKIKTQTKTATSSVDNKHFFRFHVEASTETADEEETVRAFLEHLEDIVLIYSTPKQDEEEETPRDPDQVELPMPDDAI